MINTESDTEDDLNEDEFYHQLNSSVSLSENQPDSSASIVEASNSSVSESPETSQSTRVQVHRSQSSSEANDERIRRSLIRKATQTQVGSRKSVRSTSD